MVVKDAKETHATATQRQINLLKQEIVSRKNILWLVTVEQCYQGAREGKVRVSWLTQNAANMNLQPFGHISAVADAQTDCLIGRCD